MRPWKRPSATNAHPRRTASASTNQNPALCRVASCSRPGFPSPTTRRMALSMGVFAGAHRRSKKARRDRPRRAFVPKRREGLLLLVVLVLAAFLLLGALLGRLGLGGRGGSRRTR